MKRNMLKTRKVIKLLKKDGWLLFRKRENRYQFKHPIKLGIITISGKNSKKIAPLTLSNIFNRAGIL
ncbi:MAG: type II toxin-antitoxin system HicA family toxin [Ignavibacteriales bacterium]|nr:type II toxin-antitoxin system HicA family toxin [Ignavibacteriales bacterium]